jgi:succinate dehydrogenase / fumarate reductase iron-sulfur subunit
VSRVRDHEENKQAFSGPRFFIRAAELDMHPLDARTDRKELAQAEQGLGYCNITKCCTEVCPEHIKITDNAIIPMKERVVDRRYDPVTWLGRKIFRRDQLDEPALAHTASSSGAADTGAHWSQQGPVPQEPAVGTDGKLTVAELYLDRAAAASPFGDDQEFPLPPEKLRYNHPPTSSGGH